MLILSGDFSRNTSKILLMFLKTLNSINAVISKHNIGSNIGKSKNFMTIPLISTASHPSTSSIKCRLTTFSFIALPLAALYAPNPLIITPITANNNIPL